MRPESLTRFREAFKLEELCSTQVIPGMNLLIHAYEHLKEELPAPENTAAMELIFPIIRTLEDENKELAEKSAELWGEVLAIDGLELSSPEILEELKRIRRGKDCIERAVHHLGNRCQVDVAHEDELRRRKTAGPRSALRTLLKAVLQSRVRAKGDAEDEEVLRTLEDLRCQLARCKADLEWVLAELLTRSPGSVPPAKPV